MTILMHDSQGNTWFVTCQREHIIHELCEKEMDPQYVINWGTFEGDDRYYDDNGNPHSVYIINNFVFVN